MVSMKNQSLRARLRDQHSIRKGRVKRGQSRQAREVGRADGKDLTAPGDSWHETTNFTGSAMAGVSLGMGMSFFTKPEQERTLENARAFERRARDHPKWPSLRDAAFQGKNMIREGVRP